MTRKSIKTRAQETVVAAGKSAVEGTKTLAGEFAHAAAAAWPSTAAATVTATPGVVFDKVATAIRAPSSRTKKKVAKKVASKKPHYTQEEGQH